MMDRNEMPLGFGFALAQDPQAMENFARLSDEKRAEILRQACLAASRQEMQALVRGLSVW